MKNIQILLAVSLILLIGCATKSDLPVKTIPSQYKNDNENFKQSVILLNEARDLSNPKGNPGIFRLDKQDEDLMYTKTTEGVRLGKQVSGDYLDYLHPELKDMFQNKLIKGSEIWYDGIKDNNSGKVADGLQKQLEGTALINEWIDWWNINGSYITDIVIPH